MVLLSGFGLSCCLKVCVLKRAVLSGKFPGLLMAESLTEKLRQKLIVQWGLLKPWSRNLG